MLDQLTGNFSLLGFAGVFRDIRTAHARPGQIVRLLHPEAIPSEHDDQAAGYLAVLGDYDLSRVIVLLSDIGKPPLHVDRGFADVEGNSADITRHKKHFTELPTTDRHAHYCVC